MEIVHSIPNNQVSVFIQILARTYPEWTRRPILTRLTCIDYEHTKYLVATDGIVLIALPTDPELPLGDYEGIPHMVECPYPQLSVMVNNLLKQLDGFTKAALVLDDIETEIFTDEGSKTEILLAHVANGQFVIDNDKPHTHMINRELYGYAADAIGYFDHVKYSAPNKMIGFFGKDGRGFALIMPIMPGTKIKKV